MADTHSNAGAIWALGVTQIIGYGTLYYSCHRSCNSPQKWALKIP
jgi:hypothetical protein